MLIFDIGFYKGEDTAYYLARGNKVVAFEAIPHLANAGRERFKDEIASGQLILENIGIGKDPGDEIEFFIHTEQDEWSSMWKEAAMNWGPGKSRMIKIPCITPAQVFQKYGTPDYVKSDIEGYDIFVCEELRNLERKPSWASFECTNIRLLRELMLAGYRSFKLIDQSEVPLQVVKDGDKEYRFSSGTGAFGNDTPDLWLSFENIMYLYFRFLHDPFQVSTMPGHWYDIHAGMRDPDEANSQIKWMHSFITNKSRGHCGMQGHFSKPECPFTIGKG